MMQMIRNVRAGLSALIGVLLLAACANWLPRPDPEPWRYPNLSADNCPDLSGTYEGWNVIADLGVPPPGIFAKTKVTVSAGTIYVSGVNIKDSPGWVISKGQQPIRIKKGESAQSQAKMIDLRRDEVNEDLSDGHHTYVSSKGCSDGVYVIQSLNYRKAAGGEMSAVNGLDQIEKIIEKQGNGDLKLQIILNSIGRDFGGPDPFKKITTETIKRVGG